MVFTKIRGFYVNDATFGFLPNDGYIAFVQFNNAVDKFHFGIPNKHAGCACLPFDAAIPAQIIVVGQEIIEGKHRIAPAIKNLEGSNFFHGTFFCENTELVVIAI